MKTPPSVLPCLLAVAVITSSCSKNTDNDLTEIRCDNMVLYADISEQQATFEHRDVMTALVRTVSASGIKFSDGESLLWLKDKDAIIKIGQDRYRNCSVISK